MSIRDKIMSSKKDFKKQEFKFDDNTTLYIREPSILEVNQANDLRFYKDASGNIKVKDDAHIDITMFYIVNIVTDKDGNKVFEPTDREIIFNHSSTSKFAELISEVWSFVRGETEKK